MKKNIFFIILLYFLLSCQNDIISSNLLEIKFIKDATLLLKNNDKIIKNLDVELAITDQETNQGLMYRSYIKENQGMLFIFEEINYKKFWMKNTRIPLDIIYIDENNTVIHIIKNVPPMNEIKILESKKPVKFVLEVNGKMSDKWGIKEGVTKIFWEVINKNKKIMEDF